MGHKSLPIGPASLAASRIFDEIRVSRGMTKEQFKEGAEVGSQGRNMGLFKGTCNWTLNEIERFANYLEIPLETIFQRIADEVEGEIVESDCPCNQESLAG